MKNIYLIICISVGLLLTACSKDDNSSPDGGNNGGGFPAGTTPGVIFIKQGTEEITKFDLSTGVVSTVMPSWTSGGWDISWDGRKGVKRNILQSYETQYIIFDMSTGATIKELLYQANGSNGGAPKLSPDGSKLALRPSVREGLVVLDMNGNILISTAGYGSSHEFEYLDQIAWEPSGTILFKKDGGLWRTTSDFRSATKVRDIPFDTWDGFAVASPDGKKIAISAGKHIWLMNADGSDFHAVTQSEQEEHTPEFSPDSRYIMMRANFTSAAGAAGGNKGYHLCVIPADGKLYDVRPGKDNRVIHPIEKGQSTASGLGKTITGDFVWR